MTDSLARRLENSLQTAVASEDLTEAVLTLTDESRMCFCHRVGERWAKSIGPVGREDEAGVAGTLLAGVRLFRLNAKHLDIHFVDGSRWDQPVPRNE